MDTLRKREMMRKKALSRDVRNRHIGVKLRQSRDNPGLEWLLP